MASSSSSTSPSWKYDVFLSYSFADTGKTFTSHLFSALKRNGIVVKNDKKLERGESIGPDELLESIQESRCSIVVLSKTYAFSTCCLAELEKIVACKNSKGQKVYPVFYDVDPSHVRKQKGEFQEAFAKHEETFKDDEQKIRNWKNVLAEIGNLSGWHLNNHGEADVINDILEEILKSVEYSSTTKNLVGIDRVLIEFKKTLRLESEDVMFIGIWGMGGVGKTTLARFVYDSASISAHFEGKSFLGNVRERAAERNLVSLQRQLLSQTVMEEPSRFSLWSELDGPDMIRKRLCGRKVLVVIDDMDDISQLTYLAGNQDWFGPGSRIIITTRDEHLLKSFGLHKENIYKLAPLKNQEALQLLSFRAFKTHRPPENFVHLCNVVVNYCQGLPLALKVLGSFLCGRGVNEWKGTIKRLKKEFEADIFNVLRLSFDGLRESEKNIFLDIACFFQGKEVNYVYEILDACGFEPSIGVNVLVEKCLLTRETYNDGFKLELFRIHDLLQEMGRKIVELQSPNEPGKRSRLWKEDEIRHVLTTSTGTNDVEVIMCENISQEIQVAIDAFSKMGRLRLLKVSNLIFSQDLTYLPSTLRLLDWNEYPFEYLPSSFQPDELMQLNMPCSRLVEFWKDTNLPSKLISVDLTGSQYFIKMPKFIESVKCLTKLKFRGCKNLQSLPENLRDMRCLEELNASETAIRTLPSMSGLTNLKYIDLDDCEGLQEIHPSVGTLQRLLHLALRGCINLRILPSSVNGWMSLELLILTGCSMLETLPEDLGEAKCLASFDISKTRICQLPSSTSCLANLKHFYFEMLEGNILDSDIGPIVSLSSLRTITLANATFESLPEFPVQLSNLKRLQIRSCKRLRWLSSLSSLSSLKSLELSNCNLSDEAINSCDIGSLSSLTELNLSRNNFCSLPPSITQLVKLKNLNLASCKRLESLPDQLCLVPLYELNLTNCESLSWTEGTIPTRLCRPSFFSGLLLDLSLNKFECLPEGISCMLPHISELNLQDCWKLRSITKLPPNVDLMWAGGCVSLETLPEDKLPRRLSLMQCHELKLNQGCNSLTLPLLKRYFQESSNCEREFWFCVPGSEMPKWFDQQREGNGLYVQVPPRFSSDKSRWKGVIICFDFTFKDPTEYHIDVMVDSDCVTCALPGHPGMSNHHLIVFLPAILPYSNSCVEENFRLFGSEPNANPGLVIKKTGIRIVYDKDVEELIKLPTSQHHSLWCHDCSTDCVAECGTSGSEEDG